jgi:hypothetical protein
LVGQPFCRLVGQPFCRLVDQPVGQCVGQSVGLSVSQSLHVKNQKRKPLLHKLANCSLLTQSASV